MQEGISYLVQQMAAAGILRTTTRTIPCGASYDDNYKDWRRGGGEGRERVAVTQWNKTILADNFTIISKHSETSL